MMQAERQPQVGGGKERWIRLSTRPRPLLALSTLAVLSVGLLFAQGAATATAPGRPIAWGCSSFDAGQCSVPGGLSGVTAIAAGTYQGLALKGDGTVVAWGCGAFGDKGQCGVPSGLSGVTAIAAGTYQSLALKGDGTVVAWGCGIFYGQCSVPSGLSGVTAIAAGQFHSLALKGDGTVVAWGCGAGGDFGQCSVPSGLSRVTAIGAGYAHSLALKGDGTVVAWGCGAGGDFGQCSVPSGLSRVTAIAASLAHSLALVEPMTPAPCRVPKVVGKPVASAKRTIVQKHCRTGKVSYAYSRQHQKGIVISQSRRPGRVLPARSKIGLIVSRGRKR
jgi:Regulator of chromosome condensation (RCC1) repeat/PASTA domain